MRQIPSRPSMWSEDRHRILFLTRYSEYQSGVRSLLFRITGPSTSHGRAEGK
jgi:hypothetical protein